ncbi:hypothetical protein AX768_02515 [Burkholderia sp. PAMC 28687]|uniref:hypothetical protein n=1 Tax=Burkholderia sp. PAMC 28687 TaxID=1795874 RepID=UPI000781CC2D|nr:hypothetical protein [Burkholderia sp. PAMC 28687]AMM13151.1 hypothetical protein AX768_02515 [Burkholderia sp. PAMC 28687]
MIAPEQQNVYARRLRRAVAELAAYSIDDIELIWRVLSETERAQLRPLLTEMPNLAENGMDILVATDTQRMPPIVGDEDYALTVEQLVQIAYSLPHQLMSRLLVCVDHRTRSAVIDALSPDERAMLARVDQPSTITEIARNALHEAARSVIRSMDDLPPLAKPPTFAQKLRRLLERRS